MTGSPWSQTVSGTAVDLLAPTRDQIRLGDIAHSLARIARYNGHTCGPDIWSVADHSLLVLRIVEHNVPHASVQLRLAALLHDAHEAYIGDITSPMKDAIRQALSIAMRIQEISEWKQDQIREAVTPNIAANIQAQIHAQFGLPWPLAPEWTDVIHAADMMALSIERHDLMAPCERAWDPLPDPQPGLSTWKWVSFAFSAGAFLSAVNGLIAEFHHIPGPDPTLKIATFSLDRAPSTTAKETHTP